MKSENLYFEIINNLCDGVYFVDTERKITFWNKAAEEITGYTSEEMVDRHCHDNLLNHIDEEGRPLCIVGCPLYQTILDGIQRKAKVFLRHKDGHRLPILVNIFPMRDENSMIIGAIEVFTPNSPVVYEDNLIEKLSEIAMNDALTGLPNRRYVSSFLEYKLNEFSRFNNPVAVLFMDVDNFSKFNNIYGHEVGDSVLKNVTTSIRKSMRKTDLFGRWGGEEFLGVFSLKNEADAFMVAEKSRMLIENTEIIHNDVVLSVTASIGVTVLKADDTLDSVVERADALMYKSKNEGKNRVSTDVSQPVV